MTTNISEINQSPSPDELVILYVLDPLNTGEDTLYFCASTNGNGDSIMLGGTAYTPIPIEEEGFEWSGNSAFPRPKIRISNLNNALTSLVLTYQELVGRALRRMMIYRRFLDDGDQPDKGQRFPDETWFIDRMVSQNPIWVEFELATPMDQQGKMLPGRVVIKDGCDYVYRKYSSDFEDEPEVQNRFDYSKATCPYAGASMFDEFGNTVVDAEDDVCGKHFRDCTQRFPTGTVPFRGAPGTGLNV